MGLGRCNCLFGGAPLLLRRLAFPSVPFQLHGTAFRVV